MAEGSFLLVLYGLLAVLSVWILKNWNWFFTTSPPVQLQNREENMEIDIRLCFLFCSGRLAQERSVCDFYNTVSRSIEHQVGGKRDANSTKNSTRPFPPYVAFFIVPIDVCWNWKVPGIVSFTGHIVWI
jgi:hypothetical protein